MPDHGDADDDDDDDRYDEDDNDDDDTRPGTRLNTRVKGQAYQNCR